MLQSDVKTLSGPKVSLRKPWTRKGFAMNLEDLLVGLY